MMRSGSVIALLLVMLLLATLTDAYNLVPAFSPSPVTLDSRPSPTTGRTRFAYVAMHYEGTPRDDEYLLGLRVMIHSLKLSGTKQNIVILLSDNVRQSTRQSLLADGATIETIRNLENPFKNLSSTDINRRRTYKARFEYTFNKLYLWNLTQYERVIYLDSDNLILNNPDELFLCGHFCVVFMNPLLFHTGLLVIKPNTTQFNNLVTTLFSETSYSHDGADQGFLCAYFDMENSPLFELPTSVTATDRAEPLQPSEAPRQRLAIGYNLNHFFYYTYFSWDFFQRLPYHFAQHAVPGLTIAYPSNWWLKPWYWYPPLYFYHTLTWQRLRNSLGEFDSLAFVAKQLLTVLTAGVIGASLIKAFGSNRNNKIIAVIKILFQKVIAHSPVYFGYIIGIVNFFAIFIACIWYIPMTTPSLLAFPLFAALNFTLHSLSYYAFCQLLRPSTSEGVGMIGYEHSCHWRCFAMFALTLLMTCHLLLPIFPHFIIKIGMLIWNLMIWVGLNAHQFRRAAERTLEPYNEWHDREIMKALHS